MPGSQLFWVEFSDPLFHRSAGHTVRVFAKALHLPRLRESVATDQSRSSRRSADGTPESLRDGL